MPRARGQRPESGLAGGGVLTVVRRAAEEGDEKAQAWLRHEGRIVVSPQKARFTRWAEYERHAPEATTWRTAVFRRDQYRCRQCGHRGALHAHHIASWKDAPERRFDLINGVTLCPPCHAQEHPRHKALILKAKYHIPR